jgi:uncharacterized protein (DUF3084 family)
MNYQQDINNIIEKALTEKTFTLEIIDEIKKLRELPEKLEQASVQIDSLLKERAELQALNSTLSSQKSNVEEREKAVALKERELEIKEIKSTFAETRLNDYKSMFDLVFRNTQVRENIYKSGTVPVESGGYVSDRNTSSSVNVERTET